MICGARVPGVSSLILWKVTRLGQRVLTAKSVKPAMASTCQCDAACLSSELPQPQIILKLDRTDMKKTKFWQG